MHTQNILNIDDNISEHICYQKSDIKNTVRYSLSLLELYDFYIEEPESIFKYDTGNVIQLVLEDNSEISLHEYTGQKTVFIKISDDLMKEKDCEFYLPTCYTEYTETDTDLWKNSWQTKNCQVFSDSFDKYFNKLSALDCASIEEQRTITDEIMKTDPDGYANTLAILKKTGKDNRLGRNFAVDYCYRQEMNIGNCIYKGYLPSLYQMCIFSEYMHLINFVVETVAGIMPEMFHDYWTSNEFSDKGAWVLKNEIKISPEEKSHDYYSMPMFKKMKNENI